MTDPELTRFVVLEHRQAQGVHFDLMIERGGVLATWKFEEFPASTSPSMTCDRLADHRLLYLDFEGPLSKNRGNVIRVDRGECRILHWAAERMALQFTGEKLRGGFELATIASTQRWRFIALED